jgi:hypothetical protein
LLTALLIAILIVAGAATVVGGGLVLAAHKRRQLGSGDDPLQLGSGSAGRLLERGISDLRVNDVVQHDGRDYLVEGVIRYEEAGHRWLMGRLVDGRDLRWLLVGLERSGSSTVRMMQAVDDLEMTGYPPEVLVRGELRYRFDKRGTATTSLEGATGSLGSGASGGAGTVHRCRWWNYHAPGRDCLLVEQWGEDYRVLVGQRVGDAEIEMMPGS